jgi:uncharacterized membrane protein (DUF373 family)
VQTDPTALGAEARRTPSLASLYPALVRVLAVLLILTLGLWMFAGILRMLLGLAEIPSGNWTLLAEHAIIESLVILAQLEVVRTLQAYLTLGRVRVTLILDTALVVLIGELMGLWFREYAPEKVLLSLAVIVALVVLRVVTTKFSPEPAA